MKKFISFFAICFFCICDKPTAPHDDIWGIWTNSGVTTQWTITFNSDGTYSSDEGDIYTGKYSHTSNSITLDDKIYQARFIGSNEMYILVSTTEWHMIKAKDF